MKDQKIRHSVKLGDNIRRLRKASCLTQEQTVARLQLMDQNITRSQYSQIECGSYNIRVSELVCLKRIFSVEYEEFFRGIEIPGAEYEFLI